jgi:hypothetical protein
MPLIATSKDPAVTIRFPKQVLTAVKTAAKTNGRSQNSEIVFRLAESLGLAKNASATAPTR